jgi:phytoene/squalene synthetase
VDTFHKYPKEYLLHKFEKDFYDGLNHGISLNPVLQSFQLTVKKYRIPDENIQAFLSSMKSDLSKSTYQDKMETDEYIFGSADVVGLMCLRVFCRGDEELCRTLEVPSKKLGSAFQKVNFLRDLKNDMEVLDRRYFPEVQNSPLNEQTKNQLISDIEGDFAEALKGIRKLPDDVKPAVMLAYSYYRSLLQKIQKTPASGIMEARIRISNFRKILLLVKILILNKLRML